MIELLSCHATLPEDAPLPSYRSGREVKEPKYSQTAGNKRVSREVGAYPKGLCSAFATDRRGVHPGRWGGVSELVFQRQGKWKSDAHKPYTVNNRKDSQLVYQELKKKGLRRSRGEERGGVAIGSDSSTVIYSIMITSSWVN